MTAGRLNHRVRFERRSANAAGGAEGDRFGRAAGGWSPAFGAEDDPERAVRWADVVSKTGRETIGGRIEGRQPVEVLVRVDPETVTLTNAERVVVLAEDLSPARFLNIKSLAPLPTDPDAFLLLTCEAGGANG